MLKVPIETELGQIHEQHKKAQDGLTDKLMAGETPTDLTAAAGVSAPPSDF